MIEGGTEGLLNEAQAKRFVDYAIEFAREAHKLRYRLCMLNSDEGRTHVSYLKTRDQAIRVQREWRRAFPGRRIYFNCDHGPQR